MFFFFVYRNTLSAVFVFDNIRFNTRQIQDHLPQEYPYSTVRISKSTLDLTQGEVEKIHVDLSPERDHFFPAPGPQNRAPIPLSVMESRRSRLDFIRIITSHILRDGLC